MMFLDNETMSQNFKDWQVVTVTSTKISIDLNFRDPIGVSHGYQPDMLLAHMNFGNIIDTDGLGLPAYDFIHREIPPQLSTKEAEAIDSAGIASSVATSTVMVSNSLLNLALTASLN